MTAYVIVYRETPVEDAAAIAEYSRRNQASAGAMRQRFGITPLAVYGALEAPEGAAPDGVVVLSFPTMADARGWYESPEYQAAIPFRNQAAEWRVVFVEGMG